MTAYRYTSLTRIASFGTESFVERAIDFDRWASGDYVVCTVEDSGGFRSIELPDGRMSELAPGDVLVAALGRRHATLEATGSFEVVGEEGKMHLLTSAGLVGALTSKAPQLPPLVTLCYRGHVMVDNEKTTMRSVAIKVVPHRYDTPTVLLVGTSMAAGKTTAGKMAVRQLKRAGLRVAGAKLTGAGRYRDILAYADAGADAIFDFVDVGLPSTVLPEEEYQEALEDLLSHLARAEADVAVVEVGASPMEPYNGETAIRAVGDHVVATLLAASDPYAAYGVMEAFGTRPTLICGRATNTIGGIELAERLCGIPALNLADASASEALGRVLLERLDQVASMETA